MLRNYLEVDEVMKATPELELAAFRQSDQVFAMLEDCEKLSKVDCWVYLDNPVVGTCRKCGHRGLVDDPEVGLYKGKIKLATVKEFEPEPVPTRLSDYEKFSKVDHWAYVTNPVTGTCRRCGARGLVDEPMIGIYRQPEPYFDPWLQWDNWDD